jgi:hypothetical protein
MALGFIVLKVRRAWPIVLALTVIALFGIAAARTVLNSGPAAVAQMNGEELVLLAKLNTLRKGMSPNEVTAILGEPDDPGPLGLRPKWQVGGNPLNAVVVYFRLDGARRVVWLSAGRFHYERNL